MLRPLQGLFALSFVALGCAPVPPAEPHYYGGGPVYVAEPGYVALGRAVTDNDERTASAGQVGCSPKEITIQRERGALGVESWTAACKGKTFICSRERGNTSCTQTAEEEAPPPVDREGTRRMVRTMQPPSVPQPDGAAGFGFGESPDHARAACEGAGKEWAAGKGYFACSGTPKEVASDVKAFLRFCGEELCNIELRSKPESETSSAWIERFKQLSEALSKKYGAPNMEVRTLPPKCEDRLVTCLREGEASLAFTWDWRKDVLLVLSMNRVSKEPVIRIAYRKKAKEVVAPTKVDDSAL